MPSVQLHHHFIIAGRSFCDTDTAVGHEVGPSPGLGITNFLRRDVSSRRTGGMTRKRLARPRANLTAKPVMMLRARMYLLKRNLGLYGLFEDWIVRRVCEVARRRSWPMSHVALAWLNRRVTAPITCFSSAERIDDALAARGKLLTEGEETYLKEEYEPREVLGHL